MSEFPRESNDRREEAIKSVEEMRKRVAQKRDELRAIRERFREAIKKSQDSPEESI